MVVTEQMEEPVREVAIQLRTDGAPLGPGATGGGVERDYHVAQERPTTRRLRYREGEDVGGPILPAPGAVQRADPAVADEEDGQLGVAPPHGREVGGRVPAKAADGRGRARALAGHVDDHGLATSWMGGWRSPGARPGYSGRV
jgi:hypothetical protein